MSDRRIFLDRGVGEGFDEEMGCFLYRFLSKRLSRKGSGRHIGVGQTATFVIL